MSSSCRDTSQLHPFVAKVAEALVAECKKQGLNIGISETYRTVDRQDYLYMLGRSLPGKIVTNAMGSLMSSYHQWGLAFDVYNNVKGQEYNAAILNKVGVIGQKMGLEWGGSWKSFKDTPHFQYTFGLSIGDLKAGKKPPETITVGEDTDLIKAVHKLVAKNIIGMPSAWDGMDKINLKNVPALLKNMGGIDRLIKDKIVSDRLLWASGTYKVEHVRSLIIKYANLG